MTEPVPEAEPEEPNFATRLRKSAPDYNGILSDLPDDAPSPNPRFKTLGDERAYVHYLVESSRMGR